MPPGSARPPSRSSRATGTNAPAKELETERRGMGGNRLPLALGAATGILLCALALAVLFVINSHSASPEVAGQSLCADLQAQNYDAVYNLLAPPLQSMGTSAQFGASQRELDALSGKVVSCSVAVQQADSAQASLRLTIARQQTGTARATVHMQLLNGVWKVDAYDTSVV